MNRCPMVPEISISQLSAYLDNDADAEVRAHIAECPACLARAEQLAIAQQNLQQILWRSTCPSPEQLRDYAWDLLPPDDAMSVARHVSFCPYCTHDFFNDYYASGSLGDDLFTQAAQRLGNVEYRVAAHLQVKESAVRSGSQRQAQVFDIGDGALVSLVSYPDSSQADHFLLEATMLGNPGGVLQTDLWRDGTLVASARIDEVGDFQFVGLPPGDYQLVIHDSTVKVWLAPLQIGSA